MSENERHMNYPSTRDDIPPVLFTSDYHASLIPEIGYEKAMICAMYNHLLNFTHPPLSRANIYEQVAKGTRIYPMTVRRIIETALEQGPDFGPRKAHQGGKWVIPWYILKVLRYLVHGIGGMSPKTQLIQCYMGLSERFQNLPMERTFYTICHELGLENVYGTKPYIYETHRLVLPRTVFLLSRFETLSPSHHIHRPEIHLDEAMFFVDCPYQTSWQEEFFGDPTRVLRKPTKVCLMHAMVKDVSTQSCAWLSNSLNMWIYTKQNGQVDQFNAALYESWLEVVCDQALQQQGPCRLFIDRVSYHIEENVSRIVSGFGHELVWIPPKHPELNVMEHVWYKLYLAMIQAPTDLQALYDILHACCTVDGKNTGLCDAWDQCVGVAKDYYTHLNK